MAIAGAGIIGAFIGAITKAITFLDDLKRKLDEITKSGQAFRSSLTDLYEAAGAFDEKSRQSVARGVAEMAKTTGAPLSLTAQIQDAMIRQFGGSMSPQDLQSATTENLMYAVTHGGPATADLVRIMKGFNMTGANQQGAFRRQISAASQNFGLTDEEFIGLMGRALPTAEAMGWSAEDTLNKMGVLGQGLTGRKLMGMPISTLEALTQPQSTAIDLLGLKTGATASDIYKAYTAKAAGMTPETSLGLAGDIYGTSAAPGIMRLMKGGAGIGDLLRSAAGPSGIAAEQMEFGGYLGTREAETARTEAEINRLAIGTTEQEFYRTQLLALSQRKRDLRRARQSPFVTAWEKIEDVLLNEENEAIMEVQRQGLPFQPIEMGKPADYKGYYNQLNVNYFYGQQGQPEQQSNQRWAN